MEVVVASSSVHSIVSVAALEGDTPFVVSRLEIGTALRTQFVPLLLRRSVTVSMNIMVGSTVYMPRLEVGMKAVDMDIPDWEVFR